MSRLAKRPIAIPQGVEVTASDVAVTVKGKLGTLTKELPREVSIAVTPEGIQVEKKGNSLVARALVGTYASHVRNMMEGVTTGFGKKLEIEGVGYKWDVQGDSLNMALGFSHPVKVKIPAGVTAAVEKGVLSLTGFDKEAVGQFAANIRALKKPEPYKGKGIHYQGETIRRKQGKKTA